MNATTASQTFKTLYMLFQQDICGQQALKSRLLTYFLENFSLIFVHTNTISVFVSWSVAGKSLGALRTLNEASSGYGTTIHSQFIYWWTRNKLTIYFFCSWFFRVKISSCCYNLIRSKDKDSIVVGVKSTLRFNFHNFAGQKPRTKAELNKTSHKLVY